MTLTQEVFNIHGMNLTVAIKFVESQPDLATAWAKCERADLMLELAAYLLPRPIVVQAACDCAETSLPLIENAATQMAAILALHIAREWCEGREDAETVRAVAAYADVVAAYATYAADATCAATYAVADSVFAATYAAFAATYAASAAAYADPDAAFAAPDAALAAPDAAFAAYDAARLSALRKMADIVRKRIPKIDTLLSKCERALENSP